ncbi:galectin-2-like [Labrus bergylta]|uniref:galectin-2-like n=1 Tax=Labrus bergylta TaxID=56723 RepID=UPI003313FC6C
MSTHLELKDVHLRIGDQLTVKGEVLHDAERFQIDLGRDENDLALHFNPRFHDDADGAVLVCNSKCAGSWGDEIRDVHNPLHRGSEVKIVLKMCEDVFEVILPHGHELQFPNRDGVDLISYVRVKGDFKVTSFKIC